MFSLIYNPSYFFNILNIFNIYGFVSTNIWFKNKLIPYIVSNGIYTLGTWKLHINLLKEISYKNWKFLVILINCCTVK